MANEVEAALMECLARHLGPVGASRVLAQARKGAGRELGELVPRDVRRLLLELPRLLAAHVGPGTVARMVEELGDLVSAPSSRGSAPSATGALSIRRETDVVEARTMAIAVAQSAGFATADAVKVATVVSELARNVLQYAGSGAIEIVPVPGARKGVQVIARDSGPGIPNPEEILAGRYKSRTGMGLGLVGSKRLMDSLEISSGRGRGTVIRAVKYLVR
jgi:serine/threonine-protein kinase RsbT